MQETMGGRPEASAAIWNWSESAPVAEVETNGAIRLRGTIRAMVAGVVGGLVYYYLSNLVGIIVLGITSVLFLIAILSPTGANAVVERAFNRMSSFAGRMLTCIILPAIFYTIFVPFGLVLRRGKRDAMQRFYDQRESYWSKRDQGRSASANRERQF